MNKRVNGNQTQNGFFNSSRYNMDRLQKTFDHRKKLGSDAAIEESLDIL